MNDRLIAEFIADAAQQPAGHRMQRLIALVAERCAVILEIEADVDPETAARIAANTIRAAFVDNIQPPEGGFQLAPIALAASTATH